MNTRILFMCLYNIESCYSSFDIVGSVIELDDIILKSLVDIRRIVPIFHMLLNINM